MVSTSRRSSAITPTESTLKTPLLTPSSFHGNEKSELAPNQREALADLKNKLFEKPELSNAMIWGVPLLTTDSVLLKFLKAGDYNAERASKMISDTMRWRKEFGIDELINQDVSLEEKSSCMHGYDKEGHPVCYIVWAGDYNKLYEKTSGDDAEKRKAFIRWQIQNLEWNIIRKLDFSPGGICTNFYVINLKKPPGLDWSKEVLSAMDEVGLLSQNYPNFAFKQLYINVPWWKKVIYKMLMPFVIEPTERKSEFAGSSTTAKTLAKYISPEQFTCEILQLIENMDLPFDERNPYIYIKK